MGVLQDIGMLLNDTMARARVFSNIVICEEDKACRYLAGNTVRVDNVTIRGMFGWGLDF